MNVPQMAPSGVGAEEQAGAHSHVIVRVGNEHRTHREDDAHDHSRRGDDENQLDGEREDAEVVRLDAQGDEHEHGEGDLGQPQQRDRVVRARQTPREDEGADGDAGQEEDQDGGEDVVGAAGAGRQDAVPQGLITERRQPRHEGHDQRQARPRHVAALAGVGCARGRGRALAPRRAGAGAAEARPSSFPRRPGRRPHAETQRDQAGRARARGANQQRRAQPEHFDQHHAGDQRAKDGAHGVGHVELAKLLAQSRVVAHQMA